MAQSASEPSLSPAERQACQERRSKHESVIRKRGIAVLARHVVKHTRETDDVDFWGAQGLAGFRQFLKGRFGSILQGWRALDWDGNGRLSFGELCFAARKMGYHGNMRKLWDEMDGNNPTGVKNGFVSLAEIDPEAGHLLGTFKLALLKRYGNMLTAWQKGLDTNGSGRIELKEIQKCCERLGLDINAEKFYKMLGPFGQGITLETFDNDAARRLYAHDFHGLVAYNQHEFIEDLPGIENVENAAQLLHKKPPHGAAKEWRKELLQRDREAAEKRRKELAPASFRLGIQTVDGFLAMLKDRCGSLWAAWKVSLDLDGNNRLTFGEFCNALAKLGVNGDVKGLWAKLVLDKGRDYLLFGDLDPKIDAELNELRARLLERNDNMLLAWVKDMDPHNNGRIYERHFVEACNRIGALDGNRAKRLFKALMLDPLRTFLTLQDFDNEAHLAHCRGDFRMLSEGKVFAKRKEGLCNMEFYERQESSYVYQSQRAWDAAHRDEFRKACALNIPEHKIDTPEEFVAICLRTYGSIIRAWRLCLDADGNGKLTLNEFTQSCRMLGYDGDFKKLFKYYAGKSGAITLDKLDQEAHTTVSTFLNMLTEKYGDLDRAWRKCFGKDAHGSIDLQELERSCGELGYEHNVKKLFKLLQLHEGRTQLTIWDLDPMCNRKRQRAEDTRKLTRRDTSKVAIAALNDTSLELGTPHKGGLLDALRLALKTRHVTTVNAWRQYVDSHRKASISFTDFCRICDDCSFTGLIKETWELLKGTSNADNGSHEGGRATFKDVDPKAQASLTSARQVFLDRHGSLVKAFGAFQAACKLTLNGTEDKEGQAPIDKENFCKVCEELGIAKPKPLFGVLRSSASQRSLVLDDFQVFLIGLEPVEKRRAAWAGEEEEAPPEEGNDGADDGGSPASPSTGKKGTSKATSVCKEHFAKCHKEDYARDKVMKSLEEVKHKMDVSYGSVFSGFRNVMDSDHNGVVGFMEFTNFCRQLGIFGVRELWSQLDPKGVGKISLADFAPAIAKKYDEFVGLLAEKYGDPQRGWQKHFEQSEPPNVRVGKAKFVQQCESLGYSGDAAKLFRQLRAEPGRNYLMKADLWHLVDLNETGHLRRSTTEKPRPSPSKTGGYGSTPPLSPKQEKRER